MKQSIIFLTLLFSLIFSVSYAQKEVVEHPLPMEGKDCAVCHAPGSTEEIPADPAAYQEWENSMHGINSVKCVTCHGEESTFKADSNINICLSCHPQETTVINRKAESTDYKLICSACHKVHSFTVTKETKPVHTK
ncbi:MAG: cytochrome c3 family protein [Mucispirillum sp.]|nr:cytochrome c3 family protein [Mucispirillum sp.]